tara:strand:+ start:4894 stop:5226 length:333 start_codon:yes stop_codon:yes gene_type:complete
MSLEEFGEFLGGASRVEGMSHEGSYALVPEFWDTTNLHGIPGLVAKQDQAIHPGSHENQVGLGQLSHIDVGCRAHGYSGSGCFGDTPDQLGSSLCVAGTALVDDYDFQLV